MGTIYAMVARWAKFRVRAKSIFGYFAAFLSGTEHGNRASAFTGNWSQFAGWSIGSAAAVVVGLLSAITLLNPFGNFPIGSQTSRFAHSNQRYNYPTIVRSHEFDSAVFGSSTSRLLEPSLLDAMLGGRFANFSMDAGTAWEQYRLAKLFLAHTPAPRTLILSLDPFSWCNPRADEQRVTFRLFPESFYDETRLNDFADILNLEISDVLIRTVGMKIGAREPKFDRSGFGDFTPGEVNYNPARAQELVRGDPEVGRPVRQVKFSPQKLAAMAFPALEWLEELLVHTPDATRVIFMRMPVHVADQAAPGSIEAATQNECYRRVDVLARQHRVYHFDMQFPSPITETDTNYWDRRHFRLPIARLTAGEMARALSRGTSSEILRVISQPR